LQREPPLPELGKGITTPLQGDITDLR
jgi:hypothetical protein